MRQGLIWIRCRKQLEPKQHWYIISGEPGWSFLKGFLTLEKTLESARHKNIRAIRNLKPKFPYHFGYLKEEGANHGFIHPTPWDTPEISREINRNIAMYQLAVDILPNHSTPLIIHHASGLADWIRQIEENENIRFERVGTTIGWW